MARRRSPQRSARGFALPEPLGVSATLFWGEIDRFSSSVSAREPNFESV